MIQLTEHYTHDLPWKKWYSIRDSDLVDHDEATISPWDSEVADFSKPLFQVDVCSVEIFPAWNSDSELDSLSVRQKNEYFLILRHPELGHFIHSYVPYPWDEAIKLAGLFRNQSLKSSLRIWKANKIGRPPISN